MQHLCRILLPLFLLFSQADLRAEEKSRWREQLPGRIEALLADSMFTYSSVGLMVYDLDADSVLFARGAQQMLRPASTMKLLTAIAALDSLGAEYEFTTDILVSGQQSGRTLDGSIIVRGGMDPTLSEADMAEIVDAIAELGVDTISGGIAVDRSLEDGLPWGEGWCWDDDNPTLVSLRLAEGNEPQRALSFVDVLRNRLFEAGYALPLDTARATVGEGRFADARLLASVRTPLTYVLRRMMKQSNNLYAESVLYQLADRSLTLTRAKSAAEALRRVIAKSGANPARCRLADGSGLSLYNYLSAEMEVRLLRYAFRKKEIFDALLPTLPVAGVDGTLASRMKDCIGLVFAKTGTLSGVSALAGYTESADGHMLAFAIINQGCLDGRQARHFQDNVCRLLCK